MQTTLSDGARRIQRADEAQAILRACVHCGFCNATCPTYQVLGSELDGPRGRIYLIKQMLEGEPVGAKTLQHLDRCLSCRNCETTCPSGVRYHTLLDIGRPEAERRAQRPIRDRMLRAGLRYVVPRRLVFAVLLKAGQTLRPLLPRALREKVPGKPVAAGARPSPRHARRVLLLEGCVQPSLSPNTNAATARVLDLLGVGVEPAPRAGCCGANEYHLNAQEAGLARARRNIDAWWPAVAAGVEAIVLTASGCGAFVKEYGELLRGDPAYAAKAARISALARDLVEVLAAEPREALAALATTHQGAARIAVHCPCTLQHAQQLGGALESLLMTLGFDLTSVADAHLCCGSAGTYSITEPALARTLRERRLDALEAGGPATIVTANIGCQAHLNGAGRTPVRHWIELVDAALRG